MSTKNRTQNIFITTTKNSITTIAIVLLLSACTTQTPPITETTAAPQDPVAVSVSTQALTITLFGVDKNTNAERWAFYQDFIEKKVLALQIEIANPGMDEYTLERVQYAICDPDYNRVRRMQAKEMALSQVQIMTEKKPTFANKLTAFWKRRQLKKAFESVEFSSQVIPPQSVVRGWLYFQLTDHEVTPKQFYQELNGYQLEIAHIKNANTNVVANAYIELNTFLAMVQNQ